MFHLVLLPNFDRRVVSGSFDRRGCLVVVACQYTCTDAAPQKNWQRQGWLDYTGRYWTGAVFEYFILQ